MVIEGFILGSIYYAFRCFHRKRYLRGVVFTACATLFFCGLIDWFRYLIWKYDRSPDPPVIAREELTNATISPTQDPFYTACNRFRATTNNTERFVAAGIFVPVLQEYVVRKPDEKYKSDLSFTNIVYLLGQGTSMTTNTLVYDVSTAENPDTRVEFMADPPPAVSSVQIISGRSK